MSKKKIFIFLPDGIGLRNFAYSKFYNIGEKENFDLVFWNNTPFPLTDLGFQEIKIENSKSYPLTEIYKNARKLIELNLSILKTNDKVFDTYRFPYSFKNVKAIIKSFTSIFLVYTHSTAKGLEKIREKIKKMERDTLYYNQSFKTLQNEQPSMVFCTNQRPMTAIAPILAAKDLGIPTATFIFSWDNLPKATMVLETDYYFVWSSHMKRELLFYYPYIEEENIFITGTPQFEAHFDKNYVLPKEVFYKSNGLDLNKKYICYSGDDVTTCPDDPRYLEDVAIAIRELNKKGYSLGIVFRRCPVDFSSRFDRVLEEYKEVIVSIRPKWERNGEEWNAILPTPADVLLQVNTIFHTEMVVNLGSSMVFDYVAHNKPCAYINYDVHNKVFPNWTVEKIYNFVHFRSMSDKKAVIWLNSSEEIASKIENALTDSKETVGYAKSWFEIVNQHPPKYASQRIWDSIKKIT